MKVHWPDVSFCLRVGRANTANAAGIINAVLITLRAGNGDIWVECECLESILRATGGLQVLFTIQGVQQRADCVSHLLLPCRVIVYGLCSNCDSNSAG
jgi:hypothetical protein